MDLSLAKLYNANQQKHLYPLSTTVTQISNDTVTVEDTNGNLWSFNGAEDWEINDTCALIMDDNSTKDIRDDVIISTRYQRTESKISDIAYIERSSDNSYTVEDLDGNFHILFTDSDDGFGKPVTEKEYKDIEFVYTFHPSVSNTEGKTQIAELYKIGGMRLIRDMIPTAKKAQILEEKIITANTDLMKLKHQFEMLANGEESEE